MFRHILALPPVRRAVFAAAATLFVGAMPASANLPPAPLSEAMAAVTGDYEMVVATGAAKASCPLSLHPVWADGGFEVYAQVGIDAECLAAGFAAFDVAEPLIWTVFQGGGILIKSGAVELQFRPNYEPGNYVADLPQPDGKPLVQLTLKRIKP